MTHFCGRGYWFWVISLASGSTSFGLVADPAWHPLETFNTFDMVLALTGGGPGAATQVLALGVYDQIFRQLNVGRGTAMAVVLMVINLVMIVWYLRLAERQERSA